MMTALIQFIQLDPIQWGSVIVAAFVVGFSKTGISGFTMLVIPILATVFGGRDSAGIMLPMLIIGDIFAVLYYHHHARWKDIIRLLPWTLVTRNCVSFFMQLQLQNNTNVQRN